MYSKYQFYYVIRNKDISNLVLEIIDMLKLTKNREKQRTERFKTGVFKLKLSLTPHLGPSINGLSEEF